MNLLQHGETKFPMAQRLASSDGLGWRGIAAELRSHPAGDLPAFQPHQIEITLAVAGDTEAVVSRQGAGVRQESRVNPGAIWLSPAGVSEDDIRITRPLAGILHVYLPPDPFAGLSVLPGASTLARQSVRYLAGVQDDLLRHIGLSLLAEMRAPSAGGKVLAETLALSLAARLAQAYASDAGVAVNPALPRQGLDDARVRRVIDYMNAHLEDDIGLDDLAGVACLSPFHFARLFRQRLGVPPHRFLAELRLDAARRMLARGEQPLSEIALACRFANQANFTRAFRRSTGTTPAEYRRRARHP